MIWDKKNIQRGSAILQSVIAVLISSSVAVIISQMMEKDQKEFKRIEARSSINAVHNSIVNTLSDQASCSITLRENQTSFADFNNEDVITTIKRCNQTVVEDLNSDGINEVSCSSEVDLYTTGKLFAANKSSGDEGISSNSVEIQKMEFRNDGSEGNRLEVTYSIKGTANDPDVGNKIRVSGVSTVTKKIPLQIEDNGSNYLTCQINISATMNIAIEQSCQGNNAFIDKSSDNWKCYHEVDLPMCNPGEAIVAVVGEASHQQAGSSYSGWSLGSDFRGLPNNERSKRITGSISGSLNTNSLTFQCRDITPVGADCDDSDATTLDITLITEKGDDLLNEFYKYQCLNVPSCYSSNGSSIVKYDNGFKHLTYNHTDQKFECVEKTCAPGEVAITTDSGEQCISCPAGSVMVKTSTGVVCSTTTCNDSKSSGISGVLSEAVQQYATGKWNSDGTPECRDLVSTDDYCKDGGSLAVSSDGSIGWNCCPSCDSSFDTERANVCTGITFTTSNGCTTCEGTKDLQAGCPDPAQICPGNDTGTSECGQSCLPATGTATTCCPSCDSTFDSERASVCLGQSFTATNGCTVCEGTKPLNTGCPDAAGYCTNEDLGNSECGQWCGMGSQQINQGTLSDWSDWSTCEPNDPEDYPNTMRTRTCDGATCGGDCDSSSYANRLEDVDNCYIYDVNGDGARASFGACKAAGGIIHYVSKSSGESCNTDAAAKAAYVNSANPDCVPLCFFGVNNPVNFRLGGNPQAYRNAHCRMTEFSGNTFPDCPMAGGFLWYNYRNFSSAIQTTCSCCNSINRNANCSAPTSCTNATSPPSWSFKDKSDFEYAFEILFTHGTDVHRRSNCNERRRNFTCQSYVFLIGCGR